ncbi:MAG: D-glycerate dehydrogenase [Methanomassiliicoccales archaeon]|jgi:glyoxylate reductase|nr:D-glycerate dehydrogenase [Methanomassiliicoccales archaeon]
MKELDVLITRKIPDAGLDILRNEVNLDIYEGDIPIPRDELIRRIKGKHGLLCLLSDRIDREVMEAAGAQLRIISNYAVGYNNIDVEEATRRGILVTNTPGVLTDATADLTWALIMACARRIPESDRFVREGRFVGWGPMLMLGHEVYGKTIGIIGLGDIGTAVARRAKGFGMRILYHNRKRNIDGEREVGAVYVPLETLLRESDFVTIHVPLTQETFHLIGEKEIGLMKKNAILINVARGEVVDEKALISALKEKRIAYAGLDVFENEPHINPELFALENVVLTPHTGSATYESRNRMAVMAAENLLAGLRGKRPPNLVNASAWKD